MEKLNADYVNDYLYFGYIPKVGKYRDWVAKIVQFEDEFNVLNNLRESELIDMGVSILNKVFDELILGKESNEHLVPLSGGLDSRVIFSALLERVEAKKIYVTTFGSPRSFDFELPRKVVKDTGVNFERIDCTKLDFSLSNLVEAARNGGQWTSTPDIFVNRIALKLDQKLCRWSGFIGDFIAGSYSKKGNSSKSVEAIYVKNEKRSKSIYLNKNDYDPINSLVNVDDWKIGSLTEYEKIALFNRIPSSTVPILFPNNVELLTPFIHNEWVRFMFYLPARYRNDSYLFKKIILKMFPKFMNIACKNNSGLPVSYNQLQEFVNLIWLKLNHERCKLLKSMNFPPLNVNYLHYPEAIRNQKSLRKSIDEACENLDRRSIIPWISAKNVFKEHIDRTADHSQALLVLLGLEVNLLAKV